MSPLRSAPRACLLRPLAGRACAIALCALVIGALLAAGAGYPGELGVPAADAKGADNQKKSSAGAKPGRAVSGAPDVKAAPKVTRGRSKAPRGRSKAVRTKARAPRSSQVTEAARPARGQDSTGKGTRKTTAPPAATQAQKVPVAASPPVTPTIAPSATPRRRSDGGGRRSAGRGRSTPAARRGRTAGAGVGGATSGEASTAARPRAFGSPLTVTGADRPEPKSSPRRAEKAESPKDEDSAATVTRTVRDIVEVVPQPLKVALAALALLSAVLAGGYVFTALRARSLARQRADLLQDVGLLQTALLPPVPAVVGALRTSVAYRPSEGPGAGGDFYDALTLPGGRAGFILGDVCGHGRQALARTAFMRYTLRAYLEAGLEPSEALRVASPVIDEHLGGNFATVVLAVHDPRSGSLTYACAGHPAPIVVGPVRPEPVLAGSSPPIGIGLRTGVRQTTVPLPPGSVVCLYTDGLAEARTAEGILGRPRLADILDELGRGATAAALIDRVASEARLVTDDMATVVLSPTAGVTAGGFREERLDVSKAEVREGLAERFLDACGVEEPHRSAAVKEAAAWTGTHSEAVLQVRFGTRGPMVEVLPRNVESLGAVSRARTMA